jgi:hypothetical protein
MEKIKNAIAVVSQGLNIAQGKGTYTFQDANVIFGALQVLNVYAETLEEELGKEEEKSTKPTKKKA